MGDFFDMGATIVTAPFELDGSDCRRTCGKPGSDIGEAVVTGDSRTSYTIRDEAEKKIEENQRDLSDARRDLEDEWRDVSDTAKNVAQTRSEVYALVKLEIRDGCLAELPSASQVQPGTVYRPALDEFSFNSGTAWDAVLSRSTPGIFAATVSRITRPRPTGPGD